MTTLRPPIEDMGAVKIDDGSSLTVRVVAIIASALVGALLMYGSLGERVRAVEKNDEAQDRAISSTQRGIDKIDRKLDELKNLMLERVRR
jgi:hypothetical protein